MNHLEFTSWLAVGPRTTMSEFRITSRDAFLIIAGAGTGAGILVVDGGFALYALQAIYRFGDAMPPVQQFAPKPEVWPIIGAVLVQGLFGVFGLGCVAGLMRAKAWALEALRYAAMVLGIFAVAMVAAILGTWHHQLPIAAGCIFLYLLLNRVIPHRTNAD